MIKFYGYNKCSTCLKAKKYLDSKGLKYEDIDIISLSVLSGGRRRLSGADTAIKVVYKVTSFQEGVGFDDMIMAVSDANSDGVSFTSIMQEIANTEGVYEFASASSAEVDSEETTDPDSKTDSTSTSNPSTGEQACINFSQQKKVTIRSSDFETRGCVSMSETYVQP